MADRAVLVAVVVRFLDGRRTASDSLIKGVIGILDQKRDVLDTVAVLFDVFRGRMLRPHRRRQNKVDIALTHHIACRFAVAGLKPGVSMPRKPESLAVVKLSLLRVTDVKLDVVYLLQAQRILYRGIRFDRCICFGDH